MKKYLSLLLVALMLFAFLVSCESSQNENNANSSDNSVTQDSTNKSNTTVDNSTQNSQDSNKCAHIWVQNDADQCESLEVCILCNEKRGEEVPHIYFDENGNYLEKCLNCGKQLP